MDYTIKKCDFTNERDKKNDLMIKAFQAAGFTHKEADEYIEIDHMEKLFIKGDVTIRFLLMDKPFMFMFQYHIFLNYSSEITRKKEKMQKLLSQQNDISNPDFKKNRQAVKHNESTLGKQFVSAASTKTKEVDEQPIASNFEIGEGSPNDLLENNIKPSGFVKKNGISIGENNTGENDVLEGQFSLFDEECDKSKAS